MFYADTVGLRHVLEGVAKYEREQGVRYWSPAPRLVELARAGRRFTE
jgi:3-hydroxyacyl-CoA dehydrogenase